MERTDIRNSPDLRAGPISRRTPGRILLWTRLGYGKLRRLFLVHCKKGYVQSRFRTRKGWCHQCGCCCRLIFPCLMLTRRGLCRIYGGRRWLVCKVFPIDERDLADVGRTGGSCGYRWD